MFLLIHENRKIAIPLCGHYWVHIILVFLDSAKPKWSSPSFLFFLSCRYQIQNEQKTWPDPLRDLVHRGMCIRRTNSDRKQSSQIKIEKSCFHWKILLFPNSKCESKGQRSSIWHDPSAHQDGQSLGSLSLDVWSAHPQSDEPFDSRCAQSHHLWHRVVLLWWSEFQGRSRPRSWVGPFPGGQREPILHHDPEWTPPHAHLRLGVLHRQLRLHVPSSLWGSG